jgi:hypothetical protein
MCLEGAGNLEFKLLLGVFGIFSLLFFLSWIWLSRVYHFVRASVTKHHKWGGLINRDLLSCTCGSWKSEIKELERLVLLRVEGKEAVPMAV